MRRSLYLLVCLALLAGCTKKPELTTVKGTWSDANSYALKVGGKVWTADGPGTHTSMLPYIQPGDAFVVVQQPYESLHAGQVVVFLVGNGAVSHRLDAKDPGGWITDGTNNSVYDSGRMSEANYIGVVVQNFRP